MRWTDDQQAAISARGLNLLLSAAAGSGKTTVLVERVLSLVSDGVPIDEMLIVTFSRAAAADMKSKLSVALTDRAQQNPALAHQLERLERASISTLHAFCVDLIRRHFEAADVDPAFRVLDDAESRQLEARALKETLEAAFDMPSPELTALAVGRDLDRLGELVTTLAHFAEARPDPDAWLDDALIQAPSGDGAAWAVTLLHAARLDIAEACSLVQAARTLATQPGGPAAYDDALLKDEDALAQALLPDLTYEQTRCALEAFAPARLRQHRLGDGDDLGRNLAEQVKALRKDVKALIEHAAKLLPPLVDALTDLRLSEPSMRALHHLTLDFIARLTALKAERSALTFSDLEHAALKALSSDQVAKALQHKYQCVFVDEYQDTSDLQEAVIARVARADNLFMVGDVKQSIYRFRHAEPTLFAGKYARYAEAQGGRLIALKQNFRSRGSVIALVNAVFARAMSGPGAEIAYDEAARLVQGAAFEHADPPIEIRVMTGATEDEAESLTAARREGMWVAARVQALIGTPIEDQKTGRMRPIAPRDIAVLSRTRAGLIDCEQVLRAAGVPCYADVAAGYFDALEVRLMRSLMELIENRRRDFALLNTLRSPIVGLTSTQLARVRAAHPEGSYRDAVEAYLDKDNDTAAALRALEARLDRWRALSRALPLNDFVDLLLNETGFYAYAGAMNGGAARQGNLDLLCAYASQFEAAQPGGLTGFLQYIQEIEDTGGDMGAAHMLGEGDDVVRLMTAHKSKGLEFPVVIATQMGRSLKRGGRDRELLAHRTLGAGLNYHDPELFTKRETLPRRAIAVALAAESLEEEKRILYVLMTRAKQRLVLVGHVSARDAALTRWSAAADAAIRPGSYFDMVMPVLGQVDAAVEVTWHESTDTAASVPVEEAGEPDQAQVEAARAALQWRYPFEGEAFQPVKLTVSGLVRTIEGAAAVPALGRRPRFLSDDATAQERGTRAHALLSGLNLAALRGLTGDALTAAVAMQARLMAEKGLIEDASDAAMVARFLMGAVGQRLVDADVVKREWAFNLRMPVKEALGGDADGELMVQGVVDCCFWEDGGWVLLDYKTDRAIDEAALRARHEPQLALYRKALERITGAPVNQTLLCLLRSGLTLAL